MAACGLYFLSLSESEAKNFFGYALSVLAFLLTVVFLVRGVIMYFDAVRLSLQKNRKALMEALKKLKQKRKKDSKLDLDISVEELELEINKSDAKTNNSLVL